MYGHPRPHYNAPADIPVAGKRKRDLTSELTTARQTSSEEHSLNYESPYYLDTSSSQNPTTTKSEEEEEEHNRSLATMYIMNNSSDNQNQTVFNYGEPELPLSSLPLLTTDRCDEWTQPISLPPQKVKQT